MRVATRAKALDLRALRSMICWLLMVAKFIVAQKISGAFFESITDNRRAMLLSGLLRKRYCWDGNKKVA